MKRVNVSEIFVRSPGASLNPEVFQIYRGLSPHFQPDTEHPYAEVKSWNYAGLSSEDGKRNAILGYVLSCGDLVRGLKPGTLVYFKVFVQQKDGKRLALLPDGMDSRSTEALSYSTVVPFPPLEVVFIGDSITEAGYMSLLQGPCITCLNALQLGSKSRSIDVRNQGHSGHTTKDYLPGGSDFKGAEDAARKMDEMWHGELVFSIMLGTNDSANTGPNGAPATAATYEMNLKTIVGQLLKDFPTSRVILNRPIWYSPNTHNGANYEETGLERLTTYFPVLERLARSFSKGRVFVGDERGFDYFADNYEAMLRPENGKKGTFYLHPNEQGADALGKLWANGILKNLDR